MEYEFKMPQLGLNMNEGVLISWLVKEGQPIKLGQPIIEIETDKATQEVASPVAGVVTRFLRSAGETIPCHEVIAKIQVEGEAAPAQTAAENKPQASDAQASAPNASADSTSRILISPIAKSMARELKIDLATVTPRNGKIGREEVEAAYMLIQQQPTQASKQQPAAEKMSVLRKRISENMSRSNQTTARVGLTVEVDATRFLAFIANRKDQGMKVSLNVLLVKIIASVLKDYRYMMSQLSNDEIVHPANCNIGVAVDSPAGLLVPVLKDIPNQTLPALQEQFDALVTRAVNGRSTTEDLEGGVFTITNLGGFEIDSFYPMIRLPESAILAIGAITRKPVIVDEAIAIRSRMNLTLAFDHRLVDGAPAAKFLQAVKHQLEELPENF